MLWVYLKLEICVLSRVGENNIKNKQKTQKLKELFHDVTRCPNSEEIAYFFKSLR